MQYYIAVKGIIRRSDGKIRNRLAVLPAENWEYVTDWHNRANLYPQQVLVSACHGYQNKMYRDYLQSAFKRPAVVV